MSRRNDTTKKDFNEFMRGRDYAAYVVPNVSRPIASSSPDRFTRPSEVISNRVDQGRVAQLEHDHEVLKGGFNKLHTKLKESVAKVSALEAELAAAHQECANLGRMVQNAEYEARAAKEDTEAARNEIPQNVLAEIADSVKCTICLELPVVPFSTDCRHVFCGSCLAQTFHSNGNACPECRTVCGNEPKRDFALRGIVRLLCTLQGREEPTATSTNFNLGTFAQMYREERERRRFQDEVRRLQQQAEVYQVPDDDIDMENGGIEAAIVVEDEGPNWEFAGEVQEVQEVREDGEGDVEADEAL